MLGLPVVLGDRGFRWVRGVRNWIETRFSVMARSLGFHRVEARSFWGLWGRVNLIRKVRYRVTLAHNLIRSRILLRMAGVGI
ncbi:hypothetical protein [Thermus sp. 2.9]|uniref:hypothetical protein n=1 Tax=Thermus sp. (strain 2.9) TaxID=1577051 RepID=UPI000A48E28F|nr:hypothetical protein [Thermus sp. 2.9]